LIASGIWGASTYGFSDVAISFIRGSLSNRSKNLDDVLNSEKLNSSADSSGWSYFGVQTEIETDVLERLVTFGSYIDEEGEDDIRRSSLARRLPSYIKVALNRIPSSDGEKKRILRPVYLDMVLFNDKVTNEPMVIFMIRAFTNKPIFSKPKKSSQSIVEKFREMVSAPQIAPVPRPIK
jgi:hypothetical protein